MVIDGRAIAQRILEEVKGSVTSLITVRAITVSPTPATLSYLRIKERAAEIAGMKLEVVSLEGDISTEAAIAAVQVPGADSVIVQLPLPEHLDTDLILNSIPVGQDADALSSQIHTITAPVAAAVMEIFSQINYEVSAKNVVVIGKGRLVGAPVAAYLATLGANVTALDVDTFTADSLKAADVVVSGAGVPHLVKPEMLKEGVVLIDAGTSESGGVLVGDIDPDCAALASIYTPVPGGIGPVTVACLFRNVLHLHQANIQVH